MESRKPLQQREVAIIRSMRQKLNLPVSKIALAVDRNKSTMYKALRKTWKAAKRGRPSAVSMADTNQLLRTLKKMQEKAQAKREITLAMLKRQSKCKVSCHCIRRALRQRGIRFRKMRSKPIFTEADQRARFIFAQKNRMKSQAWWVSQVHMHM